MAVKYCNTYHLENLIDLRSKSLTQRRRCRKRPMKTSKTMSVSRIQIDSPETETDRVPKNMSETHLHMPSVGAKHTNETGIGQGGHHSYTTTTPPPQTVDKGYLRSTKLPKSEPPCRQRCRRGLCSASTLATARVAVDGLATRVSNRFVRPPSNASGVDEHFFSMVNFSYVLPPFYISCHLFS